MDATVNIVGLGGSMSGSSTSLAALNAVLDAAAARGAQVRLFDVRALRLPLFDSAIRPTPMEAAALADAVHAADALVWSSPLYHGTVSGAFKNAVDWLELLGKRTPPYLTDKPVGLISTAGGVQGLQAINTMEFVVRALRGWAIPLVVPIARAGEVFDANGNVVDASVRQQLDLLAGELVAAARRFSVAAPAAVPRVPVEASR